MKKLAFIILTYVLLSSGCEKSKYGAPGCIEDKIDDFISSVPCDNGAYVAEYDFQGQDVYLFSEGYCRADLGTYVYSKDCLRLGYLGGIEGNKFIQGVDFYNNAKYIKRLWEN
jgi:hypothetical protein